MRTELTVAFAIVASSSPALAERYYPVRQDSDSISMADVDSVSRHDDIATVWSFMILKTSVPLGDGVSVDANAKDKRMAALGSRWRVNCPQEAVMIDSAVAYNPHGAYLLELPDSMRMSWRTAPPGTSWRAVLDVACNGAGSKDAVKAPADMAPLQFIIESMQDGMKTGKLTMPK